MYNKIISITLFLFCVYTLGAQTNWDRLDLIDEANKKIVYTGCASLTKISDTTAYIDYFQSGVPQQRKISSFNLTTGQLINKIDTTFIKAVKIYAHKNKLFGAYQGIYEFNFSTKQWDSITNIDIYTAGFNYYRNDFININDDTILIVGSKIAKLCVNNNNVKIVSDSAYFRGGCITKTSFFGLWKRIESSISNDSTYLVISKDRGEHWNTRIQLKGNFEDYPRMFFVNADTGYIGFSSRPGGGTGGYYLLRTRNGGLTWPDTIKYFQQQVGTINGGVKEIYFINKDIGFVSFGSSIFKTIDGGATWYETLGQYTDGMKMYFVNDSVGYAGVGKYFPAFELCIFKTTTQGGPPYKTIDHTGIKKTEAEMVKINILPNPNRGRFTVEAPNLIITRIKIFDNNSKLVYNQGYSDEQHTQQIQLTQVATGVYYIHIGTNEIPAIMTKVVVE